MMGWRMRRLCLLFVLMCLAPLALAAAAPDDPVGARMQRLSVMSQQDAALAELPYNNATVYQRGCLPLSIANGVIAAFEVTDRDTAIGIVQESLALLVPGWKQGKAPADRQNFQDLIDPALRAQQQADYPSLAKTVGAYPGNVSVTQKRLDAQQVLERLDGLQAPFVHVSRMSVHPDWTPVMQILTALHERGQDDATLILASMGAGTKTTGAPLRTGRSGHYLTLLFHVGTFMESGAVYVLDSLPQALEGEPYGFDLDVHTQYAFVGDSAKSPFNLNFQAERISHTVIRLSLRPEAVEAIAAEPQELRLARRVKLFRPLLLFDYGLMMICMPA